MTFGRCSHKKIVFREGGVNILIVVIYQCCNKSWRGRQYYHFFSLNSKRKFSMYIFKQNYSL